MIFHIVHAGTSSLDNYMPPAIVRAAEERARGTSFLLSPETEAYPAKLIREGIDYISMMSVLPIDPEIDRIVEALIARQPSSGRRRPIRRK